MIWGSVCDLVTTVPIRDKVTELTELWKITLDFTVFGLEVERFATWKPLI